MVGLPIGDADADADEATRNAALEAAGTTLVGCVDPEDLNGTLPQSLWGCGFDIIVLPFPAHCDVGAEADVAGEEGHDDLRARALVWRFLRGAGPLLSGAPRAQIRVLVRPSPRVTQLWALPSVTAFSTGLTCTGADPVPLSSLPGLAPPPPPADPGADDDEPSDDEAGPAPVAILAYTFGLRARARGLRKVVGASPMLFGGGGGLRCRTCLDAAAFPTSAALQAHFRSAMHGRGVRREALDRAWMSWMAQEVTARSAGARTPRRAIQSPGSTVAASPGPRVGGAAKRSLAGGQSRLSRSGAAPTPARGPGSLPSTPPRRVAAPAAHPEPPATAPTLPPRSRFAEEAAPPPPMAVLDSDSEEGAPSLNDSWAPAAPTGAGGSPGVREGEDAAPRSLQPSPPPSPASVLPLASPPASSAASAAPFGPGSGPDFQFQDGWRELSLPPSAAVAKLAASDSASSRSVASVELAAPVPRPPFAGNPAYLLTSSLPVPASAPRRARRWCREALLSLVVEVAAAVALAAVVASGLALALAVATRLGGLPLPLPVALTLAHAPARAPPAPVPFWTTALLARLRALFPLLSPPPPPPPPEVGVLALVARWLGVLVA